MKAAAMFVPVLLCGQTPLRPERSVLLAGVQGRIDHLAADLDGHRLFVAALGNHTLEVIDTRAGSRIGDIAGLVEPQGVAFLPEFNRVYAACRKDGLLRAYDGTSLKPAGSFDLGTDADNVRYDAARKRLWVGYGDGALAAFDPSSGKRTATIPLDGHPESFQLESTSPRIFVNVPDARNITVVDREQGKVIARWALPVAERNYPMALDEAGSTLFAGCRQPAKVVVLDTKSGRIVTSLPCAGDTDDLFFDAVRRRLYVIGGAGSLTVIQQRDPGHYVHVADIATATGARTGLWVPQWNRLFVAVPRRGAQPAEIRIFVPE